jgi:hypothetical protein
MSEQIMLTVLNEVLDELKEANKSLKEMGGTVKALELRVHAFEQKEIRIEPTDLEPLKAKLDELPDLINLEMARVDKGMQQHIVAQCGELRQETAAGLQKIAAAVEAQPKPIVRRISFFPENDKEGNYKTFIRWLIGGTIGAMMVLTAYVLINEQIQRTYPRETQATASGSNLGPPPASPPPVSAAAGGAGKPRKAGFRQHSKKTAKKVDTLGQNVIQPEMDTAGRNRAKD